MTELLNGLYGLNPEELRRRAFPRPAPQKGRASFFPVDPETAIRRANPGRDEDFLDLPPEDDDDELRRRPVGGVMLPARLGRLTETPALGNWSGPGPQPAANRNRVIDEYGGNRRGLGWGHSEEPVGADGGVRSEIRLAARSPVPTYWPAGMDAARRRRPAFGTCGPLRDSPGRHEPDDSRARRACASDSVGGLV